MTPSSRIPTHLAQHRNEELVLFERLLTESRKPDPGERR